MLLVVPASSVGSERPFAEAVDAGRAVGLVGDVVGAFDAVRGARVLPGEELGGDRLFTAGGGVNQARAHPALQRELQIRHRELGQAVEGGGDLTGSGVEVDPAGDLDQDAAFGFFDHQIQREEVVEGVVALLGE